MPVYTLGAGKFMWNGNLLHGRYTHIMKFSIFIGEVESYLSSLKGTMQRISIRKY